MSCSACQGRNYLIERLGERATARVCPCAQNCPRCGGAGHVYRSEEHSFSARVGPKRYEVLSPCSCQVLSSRIRRYNEAGVPGVLAHATFEGYLPMGPQQQRAKELVTAFALSYRRDKPSKGFLLSGPVGAGKTHLVSAALAHLVIEGGISAKYVEISLLYATIRRGFQEGKSGGEIIEPLSRVEVLAIDELGKGRGSQFELETMDELIARRYNAGRTTLFATNYSLAYELRGPKTGEHRNTEELKGAAREGLLLQHRVGERIYSRLCEMCAFVEMPDAPDHRHTEQQKRPGPSLSPFKSARKSAQPFPDRK